MGVSRCRVLFLDGEETIAVEVDASSLYEAVCRAIGSTRHQRNYTPSPFTEFRVTSSKGEHNVFFRQVQEYLNPGTQGGPIAMIKRERLRALMEGRRPI